MKTNFWFSKFKSGASLTLIAVSTLAALLLVGCNNNSGGGGTSPAPSQYTWVNGVCMGPGNIQVNAQLCQTNAQYYWNGTQCMGPGNVPVAQQYCQNQQACNPVGYQQGNFYGQGNVYGQGYYGQGYYGQQGYNGYPTNGYNNYCPPTQGQYQQCFGQYIYNGQMIYCNGYNCRGFTVTEYGTNRTMSCQ